MAMTTIERAMDKLLEGDERNIERIVDRTESDDVVGDSIDRFMKDVDNGGDNNWKDSAVQEASNPFRGKLYRAARAIVPLVVLGMGVIAARGIVNQRPAPQQEAPKIELPRVQVVSVDPVTVQLSVKSQGTVMPRSEIDLVAEVAGRITKVAPAFAEGGFFKKGELLVAVQPRDYDLAITKTRAKVAEAQQQLVKEQAEAEQARADWAELGEGDPTPLTLREPQLAGARAKLAAAEAEFAEVQLKRRRTELHAPFDGRVRDKLVDVGQYVNVGAQLARIYSVDVAEVSLPLNDNQLAYLNLPVAYRNVEQRAAGPKVTLRARFAGKLHDWHGRIVRTKGVIDEKNRTIYAVAQVEDPYAYRGTTDQPPLAVGLFVEAEIQGRGFKEVFILPQRAMHGSKRIWIVDSESRLRFREVDVLRTERERVIIEGGLSKGERVVVSPLVDATDGMRVRIKGAPATSEGPGRSTPSP